MSAHSFTTELQEFPYILIWAQGERTPIVYNLGMTSQMLGSVLQVGKFSSKSTLRILGEAAPVCSTKVLFTWSTVQHSGSAVSTMRMASWKASRARIIP